MALEGSIEEFGLPEIFQMILLQKKEGVLTLTREKTTLRVQFKQGQIIAAGDGDAEARLADSMVKAEKINTDQLKAALKTQKNGRQSLATALVQSGHLGAEEIKKLNRIFTEESVFALFEWKSGSYKFEPKETSYDPEFIEPLSTEFILMEGVRRTDEWPFIKKKIPSTDMVFEALQQDPPPAPSVKEAEKKDEDSFESMGDPSEPEEEEGAWLLPWIDGKRTVQEIIDHAQMGTFPVYKALSDLLSQGRIKATGDVGGREKRSQFVSFKELSRRQQVARIVSNSIVITGLAVVSVYLSQSVYFAVSNAVQPVLEVRALQAGIQKDYLLFALDLFYLKHGRYPDTLQQLDSEGFLKSGREKQIDLKQWKYTSNEITFTLTQQ